MKTDVNNHVAPISTCVDYQLAHTNRFAVLFAKCESRGLLHGTIIRINSGVIYSIAVIKSSYN